MIKIVNGSSEDNRCTQQLNASYLEFFLRRLKAKPAKPMATNASEAGSGTVFDEAGSGGVFDEAAMQSR